MNIAIALDTLLLFMDIKRADRDGQWNLVNTLMYSFCTSYEICESSRSVPMYQ